ncbi:MAG: nuclear transport factor 2 family protein [Cyanobacteria bacterium J06643_13]
MKIEKLASQGKYLIFLGSAVVAISLLFNILVLPAMSESLSRSQIEQLITRQAQAWENQDAQAIAADFADEAVFIAAGFEFLGKERIKKAALDYFKQFHQTSVAIKNVIVEENKGAVEWDWRDRNRKTDKEGFAEDAIVFELVEGKIVYWREYIEKKK